MKHKVITLFRNLILLLALIPFTQCKKSNNCLLTPETGYCKAAIPKFYFERNEKKCKQFIWGGCGGVVPFETIEDCKSRCE